MSDCTCVPRYLLHAAEAALFPRVAEAEIASLFEIAPNPHPQGQANQRKAWLDNWERHARRLIWC